MSETFDVAHIRHQGQDVILVVVSRNFGALTPDGQEDAYNAIQDCATDAGLAGTVALAWSGAGGRLRTYGPTAWSGFLRSLTPGFVRANINRKLTCG